MKIAIRIALVVVIAAMAYLCTMSIMTPIKFDQEREKREKAIIQNLIDIRTAQIEYKKLNGVYCADADELVKFIEEGKMPMVLKEGTLTDEQLKNGLTEQKALAIIKKGNAKEIAENGLEGFRRDTAYVTVYESLFASRYTMEQVKNIVYVPYSEKQGKRVKFSFDTARFTNNNTQMVTPLVQVGVEYDTYLGDLNHQQLVNLKDFQSKLQEQKEDKFLGLRFGSIIESNNNAGNWE